MHIPTDEEVQERNQFADKVVNGLIIVALLGFLGVAYYVDSHRPETICTVVQE